MRRGLLAVSLMMMASATAEAATDCIFTTVAKTLHLLADCTTDAAIVIPDGMTLDGGHHTITAVDPPGRHFVGPIVTNSGTSASLVNTRITTQSLANVCDVGDARLRGVVLNAASGLIKGNTIVDIHQGESACQEGNAIEVWNLSGRPVLVEIADNVVDRYQKSGIVASGDVDVSIHHNVIGGSATQATLSANAVQIGFAAWAAIEHNDITGNRWALADAAATAILLSGSAPSTIVRKNTISGNADVAIYVAANSAIIAENTISDDGTDGFYDIGIVDYGEGNSVRGNEVEGYEQKYFGVPVVTAVSDGLQVE
jgi:parallel beta-helix repeat protein